MRFAITSQAVVLGLLASQPVIADLVTFDNQGVARRYVVSIVLVVCLLQQLIIEQGSPANIAREVVNARSPVWLAPRQKGKGGGGKGGGKGKGGGGGAAAAGGAGGAGMLFQVRTSRLN